MANTFLHARGVAVGASLHEPDLAPAARRIVGEAESRRVRDCAPHRRGGNAGVPGRRREHGCSHRRRAGGWHDPRPRARDLRADRSGAGRLAHTGVERPASAPSRSCPSTAPRTTCARAAARLTKAGAVCSPSPAGATRWRRSRARACSAPSATCRPPAAPSSSGWRGGRSPESPRSRHRPRERAMSARRPANIVHDLDQAIGALRAAAAAGVPVTLWSAPGAAAYAGLGFLARRLRAGRRSGARGRSRRGRRLQGQRRPGPRGAEPRLRPRGFRRPRRHAKDAPGHRGRPRRPARHRRPGAGGRSISPIPPSPSATCADYLANRRARRL